MKEGEGDRRGHTVKETWVGVEGPEEEMGKEDEEERVEEIQVEQQTEEQKYKFKLNILFHLTVWLERRK